MTMPNEEFEKGSMIGCALETPLSANDAKILHEFLAAARQPEIDALKAENERLRSQLLTVRSDYKLELREENAALRQALTQNQPSVEEEMTMTAECFTGNCHHTRKEKK